MPIKDCGCCIKYNAENITAKMMLVQNAAEVERPYLCNISQPRTTFKNPAKMIATPALANRKAQSEVVVIVET